MEQYRDKVYAALEEHCKAKYASQPGRFAKLLLRLPALRSIGLKCVEHLFYKQVARDDDIGQFYFLSFSFINLPLLI